MTESKRIALLILVMMAAVTLSTAVAISVLYQTAFEQERLHLRQNADDQAHLMDAVAQFDRLHRGHGSAKSEAATLSQIRSAYDHYSSYGQLAEIAVAQRQGDSIVYLVTHGRAEEQPLESIPFSSHLGEPMRRALSGYSGSMIGLDYRGVTVIAAYEPVPALDAGVVAKMDLAEIRAPFLRGAAMVIGLALVLVTVGTVLFVRLTNPMVRHLTETEQRYRRIFRGAPVPIWEQDFSRVYEVLLDLRKSGVADLGPYLAEHPEVLQQMVGKARIKEANAAALRLFETRSERQFATWFEEVFLPSTLDFAVDELLALWDGCETLLSRTFPVRTLEGRDLTVILNMLIPRMEDGYHSIAVSALDVTADVNLRRREQELGLIMESTGEGIVGMDTEGKCHFLNRAALRMLGYQDERELLGREMHSLIHHTCRDGSPLPPEDCPIYRAFRENAVMLLDDELFWRADGSSFPAECRSYPMRREGVIVGTVLTFADITERKAREAQLLHARKMEVVGQLTGGIAHDFNNLITIILSNLHFLRDSLGQAVDPEMDEVLADADSAAQDAASLTRRLLAFARRQTLEPQWIDLGSFIDHTSRFLRRLTGEGIELVLRRGSEPLAVRVDRQQLENAILNLAINARDAMPEGGKLTIEARRQCIGDDEALLHTRLPPGAYVVVDVMDTGAGMSPDEVQRAVEPFYSTKPMGKGGGLGLSTALGFAQQSGGDLEISSTPGLGTTVSLYLPEVESDQPVGIEARPESPNGNASENAATILVVDDEERARRLARRILSQLGYQVLEANDAAAAIRLLDEGSDVDLVFTDVVMPGELDGIELGHWARENRPGLKVLLTSGFPQSAATDEVAGGCKLPFLKKPYSKRQLQKAVEALFHEQAS